MNDTLICNDSTDDDEMEEPIDLVEREKAHLVEREKALEAHIKMNAAIKECGFMRTCCTYCNNKGFCKRC